MEKKRGRPKEDHVGVRINVYLDEEVLTRVDRLSVKAGISRSRLIANIVTEGLRGLEKAELVGILDFALLMRDFGEGVKAWARQVHEEGPYQIKKDWESGRIAAEA